MIVGLGNLIGPWMYTVGFHAVSSGGVTVTTDPPRRCICVPASVETTEPRGEFSSVVASSGMGSSALGDISPDSSSIPPLLALLSFSGIWDNGLLLDAPDFRFHPPPIRNDVGVRGDGELGVNSVGVRGLLPGVVGKLPFRKLRRGGKLMR